MSPDPREAFLASIKEGHPDLALLHSLVDAGSGVNTLIGGSGLDTFLVNGLSGKTTTDTLLNFHAGDKVILFGVDPATFASDLVATGAAGLTLHAAASGGTSITFAGVSALQQLGVTGGSANGTSYTQIIRAA